MSRVRFFVKAAVQAESIIKLCSDVQTAITKSLTKTEQIHKREIKQESVQDL
jgi:hypothetical protein